MGNSRKHPSALLISGYFLDDTSRKTSGILSALTFFLLFPPKLTSPQSILSQVCPQVQFPLLSPDYSMWYPKEELIFRDGIIPAHERGEPGNDAGYLPPSQDL